MKEEDGRPGPRPDHLCADAEEALAPVRVQLSRAKGWRMPPNTVKVDRSTRWGNPWPVGEYGPLDRKAPDALGAVGFFNLMFGDEEMRRAAAYPRDLSPLRGKNLACWCKLPKPGEPDTCHAAVLLELANGGSASIGVAPQVEGTDPGRNPESSTEMEARKNR